MFKKEQLFSIICTCIAFIILFIIMPLLIYNGYPKNNNPSNQKDDDPNAVINPATLTSPSLFSFPQ